MSQQPDIIDYIARMADKIAKPECKHCNGNGYETFKQKERGGKTEFYYLCPICYSDYKAGV